MSALTVAPTERRNTLDVERALVGAVMQRPRDLTDLGVDHADFADPRLGALWHLMTQLDLEGTPPGAVAVQGALHRIAEGPRINADMILDLIHHAPIVESAPFLARKVINDAANRRLAAAGRRTVQLAEAGGDSQEIAEMARAEVDASSRAVAQVRLIGEEIDETITALAEQPPASIPTPWTDLNHFVGGWRPGGLYVVGARPGVGKTILGLQAAVELARRGYV